MIIKPKCEAADCFKYIKKVFPNSYLAEDTRQIIIGIDVVYFDSDTYTYSDLRELVKSRKSIAEFSGLFGVFSYETIHYFEKINRKEKAEYH